MTAASSRSPWSPQACAALRAASWFFVRFSVAVYQAWGQGTGTEWGRQLGLAPSLLSQGQAVHTHTPTYAPQHAHTHPNMHTCIPTCTHTSQHAHMHPNMRTRTSSSGQGFREHWACPLTPGTELSHRPPAGPGPPIGGGRLAGAPTLLKRSPPFEEGGSQGASQGGTGEFSFIFMGNHRL